MCQLCKSNPVYRFTNKRELCARCFIIYFQKKFLYTLRKFGMISDKDKVYFKKGKSADSVVLADLLKMFSEKSRFFLVNSKDRADKIAESTYLDSEAEQIIQEIISGDANNLEKFLPVAGKIVKPLYLFSREEILLYAKIKRIKFERLKKSEDKMEVFINQSEEKHPEVKRAIVNGLLKLYSED